MGVDPFSKSLPAYAQKTAYLGRRKEPANTARLLRQAEPFQEFLLGEDMDWEAGTLQPLCALQLSGQGAVFLQRPAFLADKEHVCLASHRGNEPSTKGMNQVSRTSTRHASQGTRAGDLLAFQPGRFCRFLRHLAYSHNSSNTVARNSPPEVRSMKLTRQYTPGSTHVPLILHGINGRERSRDQSRELSRFRRLASKPVPTLPTQRSSPPS